MNATGRVPFTNNMRTEQSRFKAGLEEEGERGKARQWINNGGCADYGDEMGRMGIHSRN
jgi:hypothetical protein